MTRTVRAVMIAIEVLPTVAVQVTRCIIEELISCISMALPRNLIVKGAGIEPLNKSWIDSELEKSDVPA